MEAQRLTPMQIDLLRMFSFNHTDEFAIEIKEVLGEYLQKKIDIRLDALWEDGKFNQEVLNKIRKEDIHRRG